MKKHLPGFVPINFYKAGIILLVIGIIFILLKLVAYLTEWFVIPSIILFVGIGMFIVGLYLIFIVPKE